MSVNSSTRLNDVDVDAVTDLVGAIRDHPDTANTTWSAEVRWSGGFRSEAHVREFAPFPSDEPAALGGTDSAPNPVSNCSGRSATASPSATPPMPR